MEEQFDSTVGFIRRNLRISYKIEHAGPREEEKEIPEAVFREALLNALTHRDYFADREHIFVHMHPGRMVITSPGGLPYGLTLEELGTRSVPRNRLIADMFHRMGYVERLGSGIHRMREAMGVARLPAFRWKERSFAGGLFPMARHQCKILWELSTSLRQQFIGALQN